MLGDEHTFPSVGPLMWWFVLIFSEVQLKFVDAMVPPQASDSSGDVLCLGCRLAYHRVFLNVSSPERICLLQLFQKYFTAFFCSAFVSVMLGSMGQGVLFSDIMIKLESKADIQNLESSQVFLTLLQLQCWGQHILRFFPKRQNIFSPPVPLLHMQWVSICILR